MICTPIEKAHRLSFDTTMLWGWMQRDKKRVSRNGQAARRDTRLVQTTFSSLEPPFSAKRMVLAVPIDAKQFSDGGGIR
ncbi:MAG: hypothetical protein EAZ21_05705 [Betaproteobacteria bacterium]|nr:MAG: hypothetical protein EAZ21_05705 [Betaproteobacteria bacterium]